MHHDSASPAFPIKENLAFVDEAAIRTYLTHLLGGHDWTDTQFLNCRGIGEKGTSQEGKYRDELFVQPALTGISGVVEACQKWAQYHVASFVVPCVLKSRSGRSDQVEHFTSVLCDLDTGNTDDKLDWLNRNIGEPTMVISSGGRTEVNTAKRHVYYCLDRSTSDIPLIVQLRDTMARKVGGDITMGLGVSSNPYGRAHQPVRIAGTCHAKDGVAKACLIEGLGSHMALSYIADGIQRMQAAPWVSPSSSPSSMSLTGSMFSPTSGRSIDSSLLEPVHAGGEDKTRWGEFNRVAGFHMRQARDGRMSIEEAFSLTHGWVTTNMVPPWPDSRVESEFRDLLNKDISKNGPIEPPKPFEPVLQLAPPSSAGLGIHAWAAHRWAVNPRPSHTFLVDKLIVMGEPHVFTAEGGSGKTYMVQDLAMKVAAYVPGDEYEWCGQKISTGGTAVLILNEDSQTEIHMRLLDLDVSGNMIQRAGDRLIVLPMSAVGGGFPLVCKDKSGMAVASPKWHAFMGELRKIPDLKLVAIDTLNSVSHGDENNAAVIAEMMREAHRVCGELGAALLINHHVSKGSEPIRDLDQLLQRMRGSSAIPSYFRVCIGMFHATDYARRMQTMGLTPSKGDLWRFGIAKCNINNLIKGERTLLRNKNGLLQDVTKKDKFNSVNKPEQIAWVVFIIKTAAEAGHPYAIGGKNAKGGIYKRRTELPPHMRKIGSVEFDQILEGAMQSGKITQCAIKGSKSKSYYDVIDGNLATSQHGEEISSGAYTPDIDWDDYDYNPIESKIMHRSKIHNPFPALESR